MIPQKSKRNVVARAAAFTLLVAVQSVIASPASAQDFKPIMQSSSVGGEVYWWSAKGNGSVFPLDGFLHYGFSDHVFLDAQVPLAAWVDAPTLQVNPTIVSGVSNSSSRFGLGNPSIGAHYATTSGALTWHVGGRVGLPLASVDDVSWRSAVAESGAATGYYDLHLWTTYHIPVGAVAGVEYRANQALVLRGNLDPTIYIPFRTPDITPAKTLFVYQARFEVEGRSASGLGGGGALLMVHSVNNDFGRDERVQFSVEPFFSYDNGSLFVRAGLLCALNEPLGFGFDQGRVLTLHAQLGAHF